MNDTTNLTTGAYLWAGLVGVGRFLAGHLLQRSARYRQLQIQPHAADWQRARADWLPGRGGHHDLLGQLSGERFVFACWS